MSAKKSTRKKSSAAPKKSPRKPAPKNKVKVAEDYTTTYHEFGRRAAALLAVKLTSDGKITVFAGDCSIAPVSLPPSGSNYKYMSDELQVAPGGQVAFKFAVDASKVGILTVEVLDWGLPYEINRVHPLGIFSPFEGEIDYGSAGGNRRKKAIPANRAFNFTFTYRPNNAVPANTVADLLFQDAGTNEVQSEEIIHIAKLADLASETPGGIIVAIKVDEANFADGCVTLDFKGNESPVAFSGRRPSDPKHKFTATRFTLNKSDQH